MKIELLKLLAITLCSVTLNAYSNEINGSTNISYDDARVEYLENGEEVIIPAGVTIIPGLPIAVSDDDLDAMKLIKDELEQFGFVNKPNDLPIAEKAIRGMRGEFHAAQGKIKKNALSVHSVGDFDFSSVSAGKVNPEILGNKSEAFIIASQQNITRAYSNTSFGNIYIDEMIGAKMGVLENADEPNFYVDDIEGYRTTIRYEKGQMATLILLQTEKGVTFIEIGDAFTGKAKESDLQGLLSLLINAKEG